MADLSHFLEVLARTATGQKLTTYTNFISGPRRAGEADGPREVHVVMLDNGRSAMLADPVLREALYCLRCGACLNVCPIYRRVGGHAYDSTYPGPIGSIVSPSLFGSAAAAFAVRVDAVRRVPRNLPGEDRHPAHPAASALEGNRRQGNRPGRWHAANPGLAARGSPRTFGSQDVLPDGESSLDGSRHGPDGRAGDVAVCAPWLRALDAAAVQQLDARA